MMRLLALLLLIAISPAAYTIDTGVAFEDEALQARYEQLIENVRCLKCQNQNLRDSNAFLASDLRREIRRLLEEGKSDAEIYDFLVSRYGEFALYSPRMSGKTLVLWIAPLLFLLLGGFVFVRVIRDRANRPLDPDDNTAEQQSR